MPMGIIIRHTGWSRKGPICENSETDAYFTDAQFYVVQGNDVTIGGNLTIGGSCGLILWPGSKADGGGRFDMQRQLSHLRAIRQG